MEKDKLKLLQQALDRTARLLAKSQKDSSKAPSGYQLQQDLSDIQVVRLPEYLGKLFADLQVQKEFSLMGTHIRSFEDAQVVIRHMFRLLEVRMEQDGTLKTLALIEALISLCDEVTEMLAAV